MNKPLSIFEKSNVTDKSILKGTKIILKEMESGRDLFRGSNKVIVSGSEFNALKDFTFDNNTFIEDNTFCESIPSYDKAFEEYDKANNINKNTVNKQSYAAVERYKPDNPSSILNSSVFSGSYNHDTIITSEDPVDKLYRYFTRRVCCFAVGIDGCGIEASRVFKVMNTKWITPYNYIKDGKIIDYTKWDDGSGKIPTDPATGLPIITNCLIPFKFRTNSTDLNSVMRSKYYGRFTTQNSGDNMVGYYFKGFDESPNLIRRYADDSAELSDISDVWLDPRSSEAEVVVQLKMSISATDCREYFNLLTGTNDSKINTISLCTGIPVTATGIDGTKSLAFLDIRPFTKFNFPNESLIDSSKGIDITYYLYY